MTREEVKVMVRELRRAFDIVRIVEAPSDRQFCINEACELVQEVGHCFDFWNRDDRCEHCVAMSALSNKGIFRKFEFLGPDIYLITAMYVEIEGAPYIIEIHAKLTDDTMIGVWGATDLAESVIKNNGNLYRDALTGAYNRQYYDEQFSALPGKYAVGYIDIDQFKNINETWGHDAGDQALRAVVDAMMSCVRGTDSVVRFGGDEFVIVFKDIPKHVFAVRLEEIRKAVSEVAIEEFPDIHMSISIGGYYGEGTMEELVKKADALLYDAKANKNNIQLNFEE